MFTNPSGQDKCQEKDQRMEIQLFHIRLDVKILICKLYYFLDLVGFEATGFVILLAGFAAFMGFFAGFLSTSIAATNFIAAGFGVLSA